jgi:hypothetical protein
MMLILAEILVRSVQWKRRIIRDQPLKADDDRFHINQPEAGGNPLAPSELESFDWNLQVDGPTSRRHPNRLWES